MESLFASIDYRDPLWIAVAFVFGFIAAQFALPPLVGFLLAGFALHALGAQGGAFLNEMADLGVTLLLFSIGLKLRPRELLKPEIWGVATAHMAIMTLLSGLVLMLLAGMDLRLFEGLSLSSTMLLGFALAFSSTVFAVKAIEDKSEIALRYARIAVGILIVQDVAAVTFIAASAAKVPSPWAALVIVLLLFTRPALRALLTRAGHGELQILFGLTLALGGAALFELVDMKGDLGALVLGALLAGHPKAGELFKALLSLKDLFLVGFFLSIGMAGVPDAAMLLVAVLMVASLPVKTGLYFWMLSRFRVRVRASALAAQSLSNFSEFGLIVAAIAAANGWLDSDWLVIMATAVALSFVASAAISANADRIYVAMRPRLQRFERKRRLAGDEAIDLGHGKCLIFGMGRVGAGAYDRLAADFGDAVIGVDVDPAVVAQHRRAGRRVEIGNLTSPDFWTRVDVSSAPFEWILLALPNARANVKAATFAREWGFRGRIAATTRYADEARELQAHGIDAAFNIYAEAGSGFAEHTKALFSAQADDQAPRPGD